MLSVEEGADIGGSVLADEHAVHAGHAGHHPPEFQAPAGHMWKEASW